MSVSAVVACYRLYAAYCLEIAQDHTDPERKLALLTMGQAWANLAEQVEKRAVRDSGFEVPPGATTSDASSAPE